MKKMTIALATAVALSAAGGFVLTVPNAPQTVQADSKESVKVTFIDKSTNAVVSTTSMTADTTYGVHVPSSLLPKGYGFSEDLNSTSVYKNVGSAKSISIFVVPTVDRAINLIDSATGKTVKTINVKVSKTIGDFYGWDVSSQFPAGYKIDNLIGDTIDSKLINKSGATNFYISQTGSDSVNFVNIQDGKVVGSGFLDNSYQLSRNSVPSGYIYSAGQEVYSMGLDYGKSISSSKGITTVHVRPDYANKTVPAQFVDSETGKFIANGTITFNSDEFIKSSTAPRGYDVNGDSISESQFASGKFIIPAYKNFDYQGPNTTGSSIDTDSITGSTPDSDTDHISSSTDNEQSKHNTNEPQHDYSSSVLQSQYNDLLAKYNALSTSDVASLAKELASLKSQMATMQAEIAALQHGSKTTTKQLSITGTVTVSGAKATVYNSKFAKTGRKLNVNSKWKAFGIVVASNGHAYFNIGGSQYIPVSAATLHANTIKGKADTRIPVKTKATIKYKPGYSVQVWGKNFANFAKNANGSNKKLKHGTSWKVFAIVKHNGHLYYNLGGAQYLDAAYATIK